MTYLRVLGAGGGALLAVGLSTSPAAAAVALDGSVFQQAVASIVGLTPTVDTQSDSWTGAVRDLSRTAEAPQFFNTRGALNVDLVQSSITAHWDSATRGSVDLSDRGWTVEPITVDSARAQLNTPDTGLPDWSYGFTATRGGTFDLAFSISGSGENLGLGTWDLLVSEDGGPDQVTHLSTAFDFDQVTRTGTVSEALQAGHNYRVSLRSLGDVTIGQTNEAFVAAETDQFNWSIAESAGVPEPSAWALSILGFGLTGAALRRRGGRAEPLGAGQA